MKPLISEGLESALVEQIAHELYNSSLYLYVCNFLGGKGLSNIAKHFEGQYSEEQSHAMIIFKLLNDLNVVFNMPPVDGCSMPINSIVDIADLYLQREIDTTASLNEIKEMAETEGNGVVAECIRDMISKQQAELSEATEFKDRSELTGGDWRFVLLWDASLGK